MISARQQDGIATETPFQVKNSIIAVLFQPALKLNAVSLLRQNDLAKKIQDAGDEVLLEEEEYERLCKGINALEGLGREAVEFVERILNAPKIDITEKKEGN